mgnify:FL=1
MNLLGNKNLFLLRNENLFFFCNIIMGAKPRQARVKKTTKPTKPKGKKTKQTGGKVHMPAEYYGVSSGVYTSNPVAGYSAQDVPVSHGVTHNGVAGPSMTVTPLFMKGGCGCGFKPVMAGGKNKNKSKKAKRGGAHCGSHNTTQQPMAGGKNKNKSKKAKRGGSKKSKRSKK